MKTLIYLSIMMFYSCTAASTGLHFNTVGNANTTTIRSYKSIDHSTWNQLLQKHVDGRGYVDYQGFKKDHQVLKDYLAYMASHAPQSVSSVNEQLAYYINLYNAATVHLILDHDIPASIKDISRVWNRNHVKIGDKIYSLNDIEKNVLQKMGDPRIHFAINCASYSCPSLKNRAYTSQNVNDLMDQAAREFINSNKNEITPQHIKLNRIFRWYKSDFTASGKSLIEYLNTYSQIKINNDAVIEFKDYDWSLNKK